MDNQIKALAMAEATRVIDALGGTADVARIFGISLAAISQWRENGIPDARLMYLRLAYPAIFTNASTQPSPVVARRATDPSPASGHAGRQPPSPTNILDTVPCHCVVLPANPPSSEEKGQP